MIFKVFVQQSKDEIPLRERTKALFIEAESERDIRKKLKNTPYLIEYIQPLTDAHLEYEKQDENFEIMEL
ncbi:DNA-dependent RNA polymerase subunit epsilon [Fervidibacillus halotolerans]|uniref:DNA-directed RNA polymerase subunit epsilon n=1 Tax=Fervidibacillus halotolerans TaxID=2980027 RepID=A0A9E8M102_9BACI|nr:DNA-directed RNA polymerase subunit epsilon [Fervidibacillus halotolerans]WAA13234.1 RNA polymerase epsilon subunit [Fervidibacillus halotolerans]